MTSIPLKVVRLGVICMADTFVGSFIKRMHNIHIQDRTNVWIRARAYPEVLDYLLLSRGLDDILKKSHDYPALDCVVICMLDGGVLSFYCA